MPGTVAITMAGLGNRFAKAGYDRPKYEIEALGRPLFDWSLLSLEAFRKAGWRFSFVARNGLGAPEYIHGRSELLEITEVDVFLIDEVTDGQATTALIAAKQAEKDEPFAVYNIDTFVAPEAMRPPDPKDCAGWLPCFGAPGDGWSFARTDQKGRVLEVREKKRISDHATVGLYWFDSAQTYMAAYNDYYRIVGREEKGERYIAPIYNQLVSDGRKVLIDTISIDEVGMLGTPEQVDSFVNSPPDVARQLVGEATP
ncbi:MAG: glycosyltransferase family 2 protein [Pseudomonadota bacterium]